MRVLNGFRPPMFDEIDAAFHVAGKPVIFTWGEAIYNPESAPITPALMIHEAVHARRQGDDPAAWWRRYLVEPAFRLDEEIRAHVAEYGAICAAGNRHLKRFHLKLIARRLSGPLYGQIIPFAEARRILLDAAVPA